MPVLDVRNVTKRYGGFVAVDGVSLQVEPGECFGLIGPNGAGKSTLMRITAGILTRYEGEVKLFGLDIRHNAEEVKRKVGYLPEEPSLYPRPTALNLLKYFARLYGHGDGCEKRALELLSMVGLDHRANDRVASFSKGMRQRLAIARALMHRPKLLMLDEPTMGLDPATADRVRRFILEQRESGSTILICTHYMDEAELLCDRVGIIDGGRLIRFGTCQEMKDLVDDDGGMVEVILKNPKLSREQLSAFDGYEIRPNGVVGRIRMDEAYDLLRPNGIVSIRRIQPTLKDSFVMLTEGDGDSIR